MTQCIEFADLNLSPGYPIQLQVPDSSGQKRRYFCRMIGCVKGEAILVTPLVTGNQFVTVEAGLTVVARLMVGTGIGVFTTVIDFIQRIPHPIVYLDYPREIDFKSVRGAERVNVELPVQVARSDNPAQQSDGNIKDISTSGAKVELAGAMVDIGDDIVIHCKLPVHHIVESAAIKACVRTRIKSSGIGGLLNKNGNDGPLVLGVEFSESNQHALMSLYAYVYQHLAQNYLPKV